VADSEDIRRRMLGRFREITAERVERIAAGLLALERGSGSRPDVARELHTLKGEARMMGFAGLSRVAHAAEDLLATVGAAPAVERLQALLEACDAIPALLDAAPDGGDEGRALVGRLQGMSAATDPSSTSNPSTSPDAPPSSHTSSSSTPNPTRTRLDLRAPTGSIRVDVDRLDEIAALAGDLLVEGARAKVRAKDLAVLLGRWSRLADGAAAVAERLRAESADPLADRIEQDVHLLRSDTFRFLRSHVDAVSAAHGQFERIAERVGSARLIPLGGILAGFPRAARDLARDAGKEVECAVEGGETGVDKAILLALNDPLVHLLRNAVDHGIEPPEERARAGKPRAGRIVISARVDGDQLALTVEDDGRGLDQARIRAVAVERGLVPAAQADGLAERALLELVFRPGFSTRAAADEVSGRGLGLDVVRRSATDLGGSVVVSSRPGAGTRVTLRLPQSLALMKVLLVRIDDDVYGLPAVDVEGVGRVEAAAVTDVAGVRAVRHRERLVPLVALGPLLGLNGGPRASRPLAAFLAHGADCAAVLVDGLHGEREVAVKSCGAFLKGARFVSGGAALEDGRVALLLSTAEIVCAARSPEPVAARAEPGPRRLRVLLVDDSAIARETEAALLRALGHEVEEAADGEEAWRRLAAGGFHLLATDVQMPVLDGIDLTRRVRASPRLARLPVVVLSSLAAPEERRRGADAGADAWLVKGELDPEVLRATLDRLCGSER
jgi:two-component system chemotaxis sensor kinase CheA/two-component system sensor histidine kinase and response regulator WspE